MTRDEQEWLESCDDDGGACERLLRQESGLIAAQKAGDLGEEAADPESEDDGDHDDDRVLASSTVRE